MGTFTIVQPYPLPEIGISGKKRGKPPLQAQGGQRFAKGEQKEKEIKG